METKILQGDPPLLKVCTDPLTEDNKTYFSGDSSTELFFPFFLFFPFLKITTGILQGVTSLSSLYLIFFGQSGISSTKWREQPEFCKGLTHWSLFIIFLSLFNRIRLPRGKLGCGYIFASLIFNFFDRMFLPDPISIIRIVEYSTISVLEYFEDTLANVGLPESLLKCDLNCVTRIENRCVRCESNRIEKNNWV